MPGDLPREQPAGRWTHHFEVTTDFADGLAAIIPNGILRLRFLEHGIKHVLDRELEAHREGRPGHFRLKVIDSDTHLQDGLLLTEPGFPDVPECMVWFAFDPDLDRSRDVTLWGVAPVPALDELEDYSDDP